MELKIEDVMVHDVVAVKEAMTVESAVKLMNNHGIGSLVVLKQRKPAGIVTERDMLTRVLLASKDPAKTKVGDIMSQPLIVGTPQMKLKEAVNLMIKKKIKKLPITKNGDLVGLMTLTDILNFQPELLRIYEYLRADITKKIR
ncbi:MAG: CBS domain-containing protein [Candidatus Bathyarchaeum sp.]|nr:MAG: CBS domain-containing protein [Candidatus Bathyarchaeum sp.]